MAAERSSSDWASLLSSRIPAILSAPVPAPASVPSRPTAAFALTIDHTLLKPAATPADVDAVCAEALQHHFRSVCVNSSHARRVTERLAGSGVLTCVVVGFPLGAMGTETKAFETSTAVSHGAGEIDTVLAVGLLKAGEYAAAYADIHAVVAAAQGRPVKVILETALLSDEEKAAACIISAEACAAFVKTCTGFSGGAASVEDVRLMKNAIEGYTWKGEGYEGPVRVKASAGVRTFEACKAMLEAGADRIGTSSGVAIMEGGKDGAGY